MRVGLGALDSATETLAIDGAHPGGKRPLIPHKGVGIANGSDASKLLVSMDSFTKNPQLLGRRDRTTISVRDTAASYHGSATVGHRGSDSTVDKENP